MNQKILRINSVKEITGLSRSSIYLMIQRGEFPNNIRLNNFRAVGWLDSDIQQWISSRANSSSVNAIGENHG
jgi:prophage regulatory protein